MAAAECPVGCGRTAPAGKLMCLRCWREVPKHLQGDVYRAFRAWQRDFSDADTMAAYQAARDAAIAAVR
jgi:hypothetical protein